MLERNTRVLQIACVVLASALLFQFSRFAAQPDVLEDVKLPSPPAIPSDPSSTSDSNAPASAPSDGAPARPPSEPSGTPMIPQEMPGRPTMPPGMPMPAPGMAMPPSMPMMPPSMPMMPPSMPMMPPGMPVPPGMPMMRPGMPGAGPTVKLPAPVQAQVDKIVQSEMLAPVQRPLPMALLGVAGADAIIRAPNGQTGLVREGEQIGGVKVLRIGTNRVLVEENGQQKELTIFSGFGSDTLLSKEKEKPQ